MLENPFLNIVLYEPEIPSNTGSIGRTCVCTDSQLHLIKPLGFDVSEKSVLRAGLDYWPKLNLKVHKNWQQFLLSGKQSQNSSRFFYFTTKADQWLYDVSFQKEDYLIFGSESKGLPEALWKGRQAVTIPMGHGGRSYNLSCCVAVSISEVARQTRPNWFT